MVGGGFSEGRGALGVRGWVTVGFNVGGALGADVEGDWARRVSEMRGRCVVHDLER